VNNLFSLAGSTREYHWEFFTLPHKPNFAIHEVTQVHGAEIYPLDLENGEADGLWTSLPHEETSLAIKTADCLAIAILGHKGASLIHAGWRGLKEKIHCHPILKSLEPHTFLCAPAIQQVSYEVSKDFAKEFPNYPDSFLNDAQNRLTFSLQKTFASDIQEYFPDCQLTISSIDTFAEEGLHSYRRDKTSRRNYNILRLSPVTPV